MKSFQLALSWCTTGAGGSGRVVQTLVDHLPEQGVQVNGAVLAPADVAQQTGGRFTAIAPAGTGGLKRLALTRRVVLDALTEQKPDIFASHFAMLALPSLDAVKRQPFVVHFHGPWRS